jgi:phosphate-selective porin OprO/OprP
MLFRRHKTVTASSYVRHQSSLDMLGKAVMAPLWFVMELQDMKAQPILRLGMTSLMLLGALQFASPAQAQSQEDLLKLIQQQAAMIESLKNRLDRLEQAEQQTATKAASAERQAISAGQQVAQVEQKIAQVEESASSASDIVFSWGPGPTIKSKDGEFSAHIRGRMGFDYGSISDSKDVGSQDRNATELRNARIGFEGIAFRDFKYKLEVDFVESAINIADAYVEYKGWSALNVRVGQSKEGVSLEESTSGRFASMMERGGFTDAFGYQRRLGLRLLAGGDDWIANAGVFGGAAVASNEDKEGHAVTARAAYFPKIGNSGRVHIGASFMSRGFDNDIDLSTHRYRQRPFAHTSSIRYVDTGILDGIKGDQIVGAELAGIFGPFYAEAEWAWLKADVDEASTGLYNGQSSVSLQGGYIGMGWFVTGESRGYKKGAFNRTKVKNSLFDGGFGAVALVARVDYVDLVDKSADVLGGEQLTYAFGVNWHLNNYAIMKFNYAHSKIEDSFARAFEQGVVDENGANAINSFTARMQFDW